MSSGWIQKQANIFVLNACAHWKIVAAYRASVRRVIAVLMRSRHEKSRKPLQWVMCLPMDDCSCDALDKVKDLVHEALRIDGALHKQWYLEQILAILGETGAEEYEPGFPP